MGVHHVGALAAALLLVAAPARAEVADRPWPPAGGPGTLFAHFGEEHVNDADGATILPKVVEEVARYRPALVTTSGDKANDGEPDQLGAWQAVMDAFDRAGVPYLAGVGNHDRNAPPGVPGGTIGLFGGTTPDSLDPYKSVFAGRPYPMGDAPPYRRAPFAPLQRPADDPAGAAGTYAVDVGPARWIFLDNSCWSLTGCDPYQARADGSSGTQFDFLRAKAAEAQRDGRAAFVVMHMPTRDPRDQSYTDTTARQHVMGKGATTDNDTFERIAQETGVDGVFVGHIKGQFQYEGRGGVPYFIDGGAGGELYTTGPVGTDHGYWHGFRLLRADGGRIRSTDVVPVFVPGSIRIEGPQRLAPGDAARFAAFGRQPVFKDTAKVEALELRDPDPIPKASGGAGAAVPPWAL
ncbi:MAG: metallophosphoesterase, partial [Solirubrobacterales bacterium]|nr:metallophosphoesterase [Solirubrobacterales bacterium]